MNWRDFLGVTSKKHDHQANYPVKQLVNHPILKGMPKDWKTPKDELYIVEKQLPSVTTLATSKSERDGKDHTVIWTHQYGEARVRHDLRPLGRNLQGSRLSRLRRPRTALGRRPIGREIAFSRTRPKHPKQQRAGFRFDTVEVLLSAEEQAAV